ncbi:MAG: hypothetical protein MSIBF_00530 [Candidatus Altiarchaeales archaeon IMC4]|nr:MAG: hypothetical protein MSIBF_00530 [Candidatus Altiarchaeales archaeon IMC4]
MAHYNDYRNPIMWGINTVSFVFGIAGYVIAGSSGDQNIAGSAGIIALTTIVVSWIVMWELYERTDRFKKRYEKNQS